MFAFGRDGRKQDGRRRTADGRRRTADGRRRTADGRHYAWGGLSAAFIVVPALLHAQAATKPAPAPSATPPTANYYVYAGAESADEVYRIRFGPGGAAVERTIYAGELAAEMEGPHGLQISRD